MIPSSAVLLPAQVRVRENAESIAFYNGDQREAELAGARLARVIATIFGKVGSPGCRQWEARHSQAGCVCVCVCVKAGLAKLHVSV